MPKVRRGLSQIMYMLRWRFFSRRVVLSTDNKYEEKEKWTNPVVAYDRTKIWRLETVNDLNEFRTVKGVDLREEASREYAILKEHCYCVVFGFVSYFHKHNT